MYNLLFLACFTLGGWLAYSGFENGRQARVAAGLATLAATALFFGLLSFWGEMLWFEAVGYSQRFWTMVAVRLGMVALGAIVAGLLVWGGVRWVGRGQRLLVWAAILAGILGGGVWGLRAWDESLLWVTGEATGVSEPILGLDAGFYLFALPLLGQLHTLLWLIAIIVIGIHGVLLWQQAERGRPDWGRALVLAFGLAFLLAFGHILDLFHLLFSDWGVVNGPGWTDEHIRRPAYLLMAVITPLLAALPLFSVFRRRVAPLDRSRSPHLVAGGIAWIGIGAVWILLLGATPRLIQWLVVEPNEITFERPYIANNIAFTRRGFDLEKVEQKAFSVGDQFTRSQAEDNEGVLSEVRLWDPRALDSVFRQFQEIRLYYQFEDVDIDRYQLGDDYRQVMISARELELGNLPAQSQTFVNRRFKYTHGYGAVMTPVSEFTPSGLPRMLVKDIPPQSVHPKLQIEDPQIYYGELTTDPAVANSKEREFDYPSGEQNVYIQYPGEGGVAMRNLWRKFVFGWMFDGTRLLLSTYPRPDSRMMFHRQITDRLNTLAPFLKYDADPYVTIIDGRLKWIVDAYTRSSFYPYSEVFSSREFIQVRDRTGQLSGSVAGYLSGANYVRNSVKAVVDAYDGSADLYVFEEDDPLINAWWRAFPDLFKPGTEMPDSVRAHVRYPEGFLLTQGLVYAKYHMEDPEVFYNQEDLWVRATEKYYGNVQPVEPYYIMWKRPGSDRKEFVLILPFTPKNRQVMIGWIAGLSDGKDYGRFIAYQFPKETRVLGPQQVETKIDQDPQLSGQLTLWDQRGSRVIRGNVLAIPIDQTLLYVEPIYLQAETAAYPELRLVTLMHGDTLSYAESFEEALEGLFKGGVRDVPGAAPGGELAERAARAGQVFERYLQLQGQGRFEEAARQLRELRRLLQSMAGEATGAADGETPGN
ncbi:UPF0182 family protein [Thiohalomonas denitrificans]|uniref:UPF0182 family protein n=1 Tax=Thiohalomonas denitrificans TaxID=415747 RepID=UPI0026F2591D|nr:UPF0182 family protein [Thiohalomonas denitrificans]